MRFSVASTVERLIDESQWIILVADAGSLSSWFICTISRFNDQS